MRAAEGGDDGRRSRLARHPAPVLSGGSGGGVGGVDCPEGPRPSPEFSTPLTYGRDGAVRARGVEAFPPGGYLGQRRRSPEDRHARPARPLWRSALLERPPGPVRRPAPGRPPSKPSPLGLPRPIAAACGRGVLARARPRSRYRGCGSAECKPARKPRIERKRRPRTEVRARRRCAGRPHHQGLQRRARERPPPARPRTRQLPAPTDGHVVLAHNAQKMPPVAVRRKVAKTRPDRREKWRKPVAGTRHSLTSGWRTAAMTRIRKSP